MKQEKRRQNAQETRSVQHANDLVDHPEFVLVDLKPEVERLYHLGADVLAWALGCAIPRGRVSIGEREREERGGGQTEVVVRLQLEEGVKCGEGRRSTA